MKRRFIAGAVCPKCGKEDTTVLSTDAENKSRECVDCGHIETLNRADGTAEPGMWTPIKMLDD